MVSGGSAVLAKDSEMKPDDGEDCEEAEFRCTR